MSEQHDWKDDPRLMAFALEEWAELSEADVEEIEAALESDPACRQVLDEMREVNERIARALASASAPALEGLPGAARAEIALAARRSAPRARSWSPALVGGAAAVAAALLAAMGLGAFGGEYAGLDQVTADTEVAAVAPPAPKSASTRKIGGRGRAPSSPVNATSAHPEQYGLNALGYGQPQQHRAQSPEADGSFGLRQKIQGIDSEQRVEDPRGRETAELAFEAGEEAEVAMEAAEPVAREEAPFIPADVDPFSTFSIDVDTASYSSARAAILEGRAPDPDAIRVEEFVNYFRYNDPAPRAGDERPFAVTVQTGAAPWQPRHRLVRIGMKARSMDVAQRRRANLVFLVDVSGSMQRPNKLPLVKRALGILTESLHPEDRVAVAVYASAEGLALDSTPIAAREAILQSLERLESGGSTNGGAGIRLAYSVTREHFVEGGVNRVILCTDGDFNVGVMGPGALEELIASEAATGVELTVLGFGDSSRGDERMEALSNRGNGNYALIDSELEARKVLAEQAGGTLLTVASDVKIQVAWNPARVAAFRLVGYENRRLEHQDFLDDGKDAGEIGAGHGVTALFEIVPRGAEAGLELGRGIGVMEHTPAREIPEAYAGDGLVEVRLRYKEPDASKSTGFAVAGRDGGASFDGAPADLRFAAAVATFAQILRGAPEVSAVSAGDVREWALLAKGDDPGGLREGFVQLVERWIDTQRPGEER